MFFGVKKLEFKNSLYDVSTPIIAGYIRPIIYLPDIEFSDSELYYALLHECMHYLHKDLWVKLLIEIICAIYWWNPLIYLLKYNISHHNSQKLFLY